MKHIVKTLETLISASCNMGCKYCFEGKNKYTNKFVKFEEIKKYIDENYNQDFYVFGGEPMLNFDVIVETIKYLNTLNISKERKFKLMSTFGKITTNGTLIKKYFDKIKMLNDVEDFKFHFQISLDGPKDINDMNRYYKDKSSTYDDIIEGIKLLEENNMSYDIHGVLPPEALLNYLDIIKWRIDLYKNLNKSTNEIISRFKGNWAMAIFEYDYTDEFIDKFLIELEKTAEWIMYNDDFTKEQKKSLYDNIITRRKVYGICAAGRGLKTLDTSGNIYPCHRSVDELTTYNFKDEACLGNIDDVENFKNFKLFNRFDFVAEQGLAYSTDFIMDVYDKYKTGNNNFNKMCWGMWCPTSNIETSNNEAHINTKYIILIKEVNNFISNYLDPKYFGNKNKKNEIFI